MKTPKVSAFVKTAGRYAAVAALLWVPAHAATAGSGGWPGPSDFMPHGYCYLWKPEIIWLHAISDGLIALSYYFIPLTLVYLVRKRRDLPFNWVFLMFGVFILS